METTERKIKGNENKKPQVSRDVNKQFNDDDDDAFAHPRPSPSSLPSLSDDDAIDVFCLIQKYLLQVLAFLLQMCYPPQHFR